MSSPEHKTIYLKDYKVPPFLVDEIDLRFELHETATRIISTLTCRRNPASREYDAPLVLNGEELELCAARLDGTRLTQRDYTVDATGLTIARVPDEPFVLSLETEINPSANTALEGLYLSSGNFCTQCEAEGFRRITFFPDRPDVMSLYTTTIVADPQKYPVLLANGNLVEQGRLKDGRGFAVWRDPYKKPCYLFALVAGDLVCIEDTFRIRSGREVTLRIFVEERNRDQCAHAMRSLQKAMAWDEEKFGREYDLDVYMIVAVDDFNMGAMENKGLNVFNSKYVLARPETATDQDYDGIEGVIAHEYFHNWTGNRVTCRDWFQLSLKEGLTVFRDQEFSADMSSSRAVKRIHDARIIRNFQFREDGGPMAHPVRPDSYMEINNFYTLTVYDKGAEVIRMIHFLLGPDGFRAGMDLYFERHDGQAVTCEDFVQAMADATGFDFSRFKLWYSQAGTPELRARGRYDRENKRYDLTIAQSCPSTPGQTTKEPLLIPVAVGLLTRDGNDLPLRLVDEPEKRAQTTKTLLLDRAEQSFVFTDIREEPVLSFLRGFSAPVKVEVEQDDQEVAFLMAHDSDPFNRWSAGQHLSQKYLLTSIGRGDSERELAVPDLFAESFQTLLNDQSADPAFVALALEPPPENWLNQLVEPIDPEAIFKARQAFRRGLAERFRDDFLRVYRDNTVSGPYKYDPVDAGRRALKNMCLDYLLCGGPRGGLAPELLELGTRQYYEADNMTDVMAALRAVVNADRERGDQLLAHFYDTWRDDPLVLDKWFSLQALCTLPGTLNRVRDLTEHTAFSIKNPNKVRALIGVFCSANHQGFHEPQGRGYGFLADIVLKLNGMNPQIAARLLTPLTSWRRYEPGRRELMRRELERVRDAGELSRDVAEVVGKSLAS